MQSLKEAKARIRKIEYETWKPLAIGGRFAEVDIESVKVDIENGEVDIEKHKSGHSK